MNNNLFQSFHSSINYIYTINNQLCKYFVRYYYDTESVFRKVNIADLMEKYFHLNELYIQLNSFRRISNSSSIKYNYIDDVFKNNMYGIINKDKFTKIDFVIDESSYDFFDNKYFYYHYVNTQYNIDKLNNKKQYFYHGSIDFFYSNINIIRKKLFSYHLFTIFSTHHYYYNPFFYPNIKNNLLNNNGILYTYKKYYRVNIMSNYNKYVRYLNYYILSMNNKNLSEKLLLSSNVYLTNLISSTMLDNGYLYHIDNKILYNNNNSYKYFNRNKINKYLLMFNNTVLNKKRSFFLNKKITLNYNIKRIGIIHYNNTMRNIFITLSTYDDGKHIYHISSGHLKYLGRKKIADTTIYNLVSKFIYKIRVLSVKHCIHYFRIIINGYFDNISVFLKPILSKWYNSSNVVSMFKKYLLFIKKYIIYLKNLVLNEKKLIKFNINQYYNIIYDFFSIHKYIQYKSEKHFNNHSIRLLDIQVKNKKFFSK